MMVEGVEGGQDQTKETGTNQSDTGEAEEEKYQTKIL